MPDATELQPGEGVTPALLASDPVCARLDAIERQLATITKVLGAGFRDLTEAQRTMSELHRVALGEQRPESLRRFRHPAS